MYEDVKDQVLLGQTGLVGGVFHIDLQDGCFPPPTCGWVRPGGT